MLALREYQNKIIEDVRSKMLEGIKSVLVTAPTGSGKTILTATMLKTAESQGMSTWFVVHRRELIKQSLSALESVGIQPGVVASGWPIDWAAKTHICSVQTLVRKMKMLKKPTLTVWDECFPAGTLVDGSPIEKTIVGDEVISYNEATRTIEKSKVTSIFVKAAPKRLFVLKTRDGKSVCCTGNHPFFTKNRGWIDCEKLSIGEKIYVVHGLQKTFKAEGYEKMSPMLSHRNVKEKCFDGPGKNENQKPNVDAWCEKENGFNPKKDRTQASEARREWASASIASKNAGKGAAIENGSCVFDWNKIFLSDPLQIGHCGPKNKISDRGGRGFARTFVEAEARQEEGISLKEVWVDSIEVYEQRDFEKFRKLCPNGLVYNLEVEKNHTYFANEILVHNCHHLSAGSWKKIYDANPQAFHIGLTATPERLDGQGLASFFKSIVCGPSTAELTELGYLSPYRLYAPSTIDLTGVRTRMGDYDKKGLAEASDKPVITGDAIKHYRQYADGKKALVFCCSIEHSKNVISQFLSVGITAEHIDGETPIEQRDAALRRFKDGITKVISSVELFSEGFDLPGIECAILLRPTQSLGLFLQQIGRCLRISPGKSESIILDHAGNCERHGLPDDDRQWSLEGRRKSKAGTGPTVRVKICSHCYAAQTPGASACRFCGTAFKIAPREVLQADGDLKEVNARRIRAQRAFESSQAQTYEQLVELGKKRGYNPLWATHVWKARHKDEVVAF